MEVIRLFQRLNHFSPASTTTKTTTMSVQCKNIANCSIRSPYYNSHPKLLLHILIAVFFFVTSFRLCLLRVPHKSHAPSSGGHARRSLSGRLCVLRLPHARPSGGHARRSLSRKPRAALRTPSESTFGQEVHTDLRTLSVLLTIC